ncbi:MAG TPA: hypothetical protein DHS57_00030 [Erysipelotrichaceae bacterium]|nr:hypothetical protein [Erysipelotrichaceae bacterium]
MLQSSKVKSVLKLLSHSQVRISQRFERMATYFSLGKLALLKANFIDGQRESLDTLQLNRQKLENGLLRFVLKRKMK